jgi:hypothetical protein
MKNIEVYVNGVWQQVGRKQATVLVDTEIGHCGA